MRQVVPLVLAGSKIEELCRCVVQHASEDEDDEVQRLLGQLATLRSLWDGGGEEPFAWTPPPGTEALAGRALQALRSVPKRGRFRRDR